jgi:hypothetical protein
MSAIRKKVSRFGTVIMLEAIFLILRFMVGNFQLFEDLLSKNFIQSQIRRSEARLKKFPEDIDNESEQLPYRFRA